MRNFLPSRDGLVSGEVLPYIEGKVHPGNCPQYCHLDKVSRSNIEKTLQGSIGDFDQLYVHLTITGLGGTEIEPNVPGYKKALSVLPDLIDSVGSPDRIRIRPDLLIRLKKNDTIIDNFEDVKDIISTTQSCGVNTFSTSFCSPYE